MRAFACSGVFKILEMAHPLQNSKVFYPCLSADTLSMNISVIKLLNFQNFSKGVWGPDVFNA